MRHWLLLFILGIMPFCRTLSQESLLIPTETRFWDKSGAYNGYTLFAGNGKTYLIDMEGHIIKTWNIGTNPRLSENGTIVDATKPDPSGFSGWQELDWNGNVIWSYTEKRTGYAPHHDFKKIWNKKLNAWTFLYIANKTVTQQQCLDAGCNPAYTNQYKTAQMDAIVEVDMAGNVIWEWWFFDHAVQDLDATKTATYGVVSKTPGKIDLNLPGRPVKSDWLHCNSLDYNQDLDLIVTNSVQGEFYVIDHGNTFMANNPTESIRLAATSAGDFLYRFGDPARYEQGDPPSILEDWTNSTAGHKQIGGSHDIQWIRTGLPGAGNFLIFNNGEYLFEHTPQSYIFEINPYLSSTGTGTSFVNPPEAGYTKYTAPNKDQMKQTKNQSRQIVWSYSSKNSVNFYSTIGSSAQRLPNGNTFICAMNSGHFFEVTSSGTVVWEYISPCTRDGIRKIITDNYPTYNAAFRAYRYGADFQGLKGRDLTAGKTITGFDPDYILPADLTTGTSGINAIIPPGEDSGSTLENYPNPFTRVTTISYSLEESHRVQLMIYTQNGQLVRELVNTPQVPGKYSVNWDATSNNGSRVSTGMFYYVLKLDDEIQSKKMIYFR